MKPTLPTRCSRVLQGAGRRQPPEDRGLLAEKPRAVGELPAARPVRLPPPRITCPISRHVGLVSARPRSLLHLLMHHRELAQMAQTQKINWPPAPAAQPEEATCSTASAAFGHTTVQAHHRLSPQEKNPVILRYALQAFEPGCATPRKRSTKSCSASTRTPPRCAAVHRNHMMQRDPDGVVLDRKE
jgi:hypothetical protein